MEIKKSIINISFCLVFLTSILSFQTKKEEVLILSYSAIDCPCAQWKIENQKNTKNIYLERANNKILDADKIWDGKTLPLKLRLKGYFKKDLGIPRNFSTKGNPKPGKVFLYTKIEEIK
ncbi:hypothetical protein ACWA1F_05550 [Flavobacterium sp. 3-218]